MPVATQVFDVERNITQYTISSSGSTLVVKVLDYGATITNVLVNDKNGQQRDVVLGFDTFDGYLSKEVKNPYFGAAIGRIGNRIANASFTLNGNTYSLPVNNGPNSLHGGLEGFDKKVWSLVTQTDNSITLELISEDGDQGYPGTIRAVLTYTVTDNNELQLDYLAELTENQSLDTIINLTNHTYFNLNGATNADEVQILNHVVTMKAEQYLEVNSTLIPTGKLLSTKTDNPLMDFATDDLHAHTIGERIESVKPNGYDHCYVIDSNPDNFNIRGGSGEVRKDVVVVRSPISGITLTLSTSEPAYQFFTGSNITEAHKTKNSQNSEPISLKKFAGFCLEAQRFPNAINIENWKKQVILSPGEKYTQKTIYRFNS